MSGSRNGKAIHQAEGLDELGGDLRLVETHREPALFRLAPTIQDVEAAISLLPLLLGELAQVGPDLVGKFDPGQARISVLALSSRAERARPTLRSRWWRGGGAGRLTFRIACSQWRD